MAKKRKKCPFCGAEVNKENLDRHFLKVHRDLDERDFEKKGLKKPARAGKRKPRKVGKREAKKGNVINNNKRNAVIAAIVLVLVVSIIGAAIYQSSNDNGKPDEENPDNGNGQVDLPIAVMTTTMGTIKIELDTEKAPLTAQNFIDLANSGFYDGIIFHRVIYNFMIQGGGFTSNGTEKDAAQIPWENTGLQNRAYSIAMARTGNPNSQADSGTGSSQFFINHVDNTHLDKKTPSNENGVEYPYVVFGRVTEGFSVVDAIATLPTTTYNGMEDWPENPPVITSIVI